VMPLSGGELQGIVRQQLPTVIGDEMHSVDDELEDTLRNKVVEIHPHQPGLMPSRPATMADSKRRRWSDRTQQAVAVGSCQEQPPRAGMPKRC